MRHLRSLLSLALICHHFHANNAAAGQKLESASLIGGRAASAKEAKYLVSLQSDDDDEGHFCGGSILNDWHIVTAAHCVFDDGNEFLEKPIRVVAGTGGDLNNDDEGRVARGVRTIYVPEKYNDSEWLVSLPRGDIAVLKLNESLNLRLNDKLRRLRLPRRRGRKYRDYEGEEVVISGFGWDKVRVKHQHRAGNNDTREYEVGSTSARLRSAKARVVANADCQKLYVDVIRDSELCARVVEHEDDTPQGVCRGDSGSPLVYKTSTIIGVVSGIAVGCNENEQPGIYSRISSYVGFIRNAVRGSTERMRVKEFL